MNTKKHVSTFVQPSLYNTRSTSEIITTDTNIYIIIDIIDTEIKEVNTKIEAVQAEIQAI